MDLYRFVSVTLVLCVFLAFLSGCSGGNENDSTNTNKSAEVVETEDEVREVERETSEEIELVRKGDETESATETTYSEVDKEIDEELAKKGEEFFQTKGCVACHTVGKGKLVGPDLIGVTEKRTDKWLSEWLKNPDEMLRTDPIAKELLKEYLVPMPDQGLTDEEVDALIAYMKYEDSQAQIETDGD